MRSKPSRFASRAQWYAGMTDELPNGWSNEAAMRGIESTSSSGAR
jgi:hypothetical protein